MSRSCLIVGNGVVGLMLARQLVRDGFDVTIVGPRQRPGAASLAAGAMLGHFGEVTKDTFACAPATAKFDVGHEATELWPATISDLCAHAGVDPERLKTADDTYVVLNGRGGVLDSENFDAIETALHRAQVAYECGAARDVPGFRPPPSGRALRALRVRDEGAVDGNLLLQLLDSFLAEAQVKMVDGSVEHLLCSDGAVTGVALHDGATIGADLVVVAAGAASARLLETVPGLEIQPMLAGVGTAVVTRRATGTPFESVVRTPNRGGACGLHVVPLGQRREYFGASNILNATPRTSATVATVRVILDQAIAQLDELASMSEIDSVRVGNRPVALDGFPLIGPMSVAGLFVVTGTYRDGLQASPALAVRLSCLLQGEPQPELEPFRPERTPIALRSVEESVEETALHMTSLWVETGGFVPPQMPTRTVTDHFRHQAEEVYRKHGTATVLTPDLVCYLITCEDLSELVPVARYLARRRQAVYAGVAG